MINSRSELSMPSLIFEQWLNDQREFTVGTAFEYAGLATGSAAVLWHLWAMA